MEYQTHEHDVLVIGAGGAGLRAAIEAAANGVRVGLVCKSLLGKAHTVMAEGGAAAAMGNVDDRDNWRVHFADTLRGGQYLNNWRMAELHAREAPECVRELEAWGALFDRTADGRILQRLARDVERKIVRIDHPAHEAQPLREQILAVVHDEHALGEQPHPAPLTIHVERWILGNEQEAHEFLRALDAKMGACDRLRTISG